MPTPRLEPLPADPLGQRLCEIFSYRWMFIESEDTTNINWRTVRNYPIRPRSLWQRWQDPNRLIGVRFGHTTNYALIDIDRGSPYLNGSSLARIRAALETIGICRTLPIRSSWNGGIHLYIPMPEPIKTFDLAVALKECLQAQGFQLDQGKLEIFPNVKSFGKPWLGQFTEYNGHRLPLQPGSGSCLLNDDLQPLGGDLQRFVWAWDFGAAAQDMESLQQALSIGRNNHRKKPKRQARNHPVDAWRDDLETEIGEGWTSHGQTNQLLKAIACYGVVFERLTGDELAQYIEDIAVARPGYQQWCRHQHEISMRSAVWAAAAERYYWPLGEAPIRNLERYSLNEQRKDDAISRIKAAIRTLINSQQWSDRIGDRLRAIVKLASVSTRTLYKHLNLWHPDHWCKNPVTEGDTADNSSSSTSPPKIPESLQREGFYTEGENMKGVGDETPLKRFFPPDRGGTGGVSVF